MRSTVLSRRRREVEAIFEKYGLLDEEREYLWRSIVALCIYEFGTHGPGVSEAYETMRREGVLS